MSAALNCQACGACCVEAGAVPVERSEWMPPQMLCPKEDDGDRRFMAKHLGGRCVALEGEIGTSVRCGVYSRGPRVCQAFKPGSEGCLASRERMAWKLSHMDWKPHGYGPTTPVAPNLAQGGEL